MLSPKKQIPFLVFLLIVINIFFQDAQSQPEDFGKLLTDDKICSIWWTEGTYKVLKEQPVPIRKSAQISLWSARNEFESFQVILHSKKRLENVRISVNDFINENGDRISSEMVIIRKVEYVYVTKPTDDYGKVGWWPDPLPVNNKPVRIYPGENSPFWMTIQVPENTSQGIYKSRVNITSGNWEVNLQVQLTVWPFVLPNKTSIRSAFGVGTSFIQRYHNLETEEELRQVTDKYYKALQNYRLSPTSPFDLYPIKLYVSGIDWEGGIFVTDTVYEGKHALKIMDHSEIDNIEAKTKDLIRIDPSVEYKLSWFVRTMESDQQYSILVKGYNAEKEYMPFENRMDVFTGENLWQQKFFSIGKFRPEVKYITLHLFPVFRDLNGSKTGAAWFDDVKITAGDQVENLIPQGNFEVDLNNIELTIDFSDFDRAAKRYLDDFGFNAFNLRLEGMPSGNYYSQNLGVFKGFPQRTPEYDKLMKQYLEEVQNHLEEKRWLGKEYVYWFDEPNTENYPFVREGMEILYNSAPKIKRFITEHQPGPDIMDISEISCTIWHRMDPAIVKELSQEGREFWSYLCCWPKSPWISEFIDHDGVNLRMWLWMSYHYQLKGILIWSTTYWNSDAASPNDYLQNPWEDPMSYVTGYGWPFGKQTIWGNGDGRFFYPPNRNPNDQSTKYLDDPIPSLRLEILREGIEDYEYMVLLEKEIEEARIDAKYQNLVTKAEKLLQFPDEMFSDGKTYNKDPQYLLDYRKQIAEILVKFMSVNAE